ncbi:type II toxin-antitoxin system RatA family toxin [Jannaschia sp. S6380]|uniref:type II toxin-antitoxin system RatA family toxin n=1 Tax=Jannaschia sp. S6380 TaxID=2926408 RepID=UPI001FF6D6E4|nr:type II toxin-antitoxin system RatA family toxin [Jannaschia sp. S6380]MCK0166590.1 type II toxin-antitoxin system RatA family toxin [Jannaschia sp. S6380]
MPRHSESRDLPYSAEQMYDLVADVARYPEFLPWTAAARIRSRDGGPEGEVMLADLVISFKVFRESFGSKVTLWPDERRIETEYLDGPFHHMQSEWRFEPLENGCRVHFWVDFEFKNKLVGRVVGSVFNQAMHRVVAAFEKRARELYGPANA